MVTWWRKQRLEWTLKTEEGTMSQELQAVTEAEKRKKRDSSLKTPRRNWPVIPLIWNWFGISDLYYCEMINSHSLKPLNVWQAATAVIGNWYSNIWWFVYDVMSISNYIKKDAATSKSSETTGYLYGKDEFGSLLYSVHKINK